MNSAWHFPLMVMASFLIFFLILKITLSKAKYKIKRKQVSVLALIVVVGGMLIGKYGAVYGFPWWIYYPLPMLITVILPPLVLKLNRTETVVYIVLSFLSAPFIHAAFSFFLGWTEYMPFWKIPFIGNLF